MRAPSSHCQTTKTKIKNQTKTKPDRQKLGPRPITNANKTKVSEAAFWLIRGKAELVLYLVSKC